MDRLANFPGDLCAPNLRVQRHDAVDQRLGARWTPGDIHIYWHDLVDSLPGRRVDNVGFFAVDDIDLVSDPDLYDRLLTEFPSWLAAARQAGILGRPGA